MYKALNLWLPAYFRCPARPAANGTTDLIIAICDHFEPLHDSDKAGALARIATWQQEYPRIHESFRDSDGIAPRHTFFTPIEQYDADLLNPLADICQRTGAEVEIHLHHDGDNAEQLRNKIEQGKKDLCRHGFLSRDGKGSVRYGFVHGDWALDNSHPTGRHCGVRNELAVLRSTGCYADFTMPSAPSPTQARMVNSLYYAHGTDLPRSFDRGEPVRASSTPATQDKQRPAMGEMLLIQGPLGLNWGWRKCGVFPRIENADLTGANPPQLRRLRLWERLGIHVQGRPEWVFIKLHTHGGIPRNFNMLLGEPMRQFHQCLKEYCTHTTFKRFHYVTAREMVNMVHAAEDGLSGNPGQYRDYRYKKPLCSAH